MVPPARGMSYLLSTVLMVDTVLPSFRVENSRHIVFSFPASMAAAALSSASMEATGILLTFLRMPVITVTPANAVRIMLELYIAPLAMPGPVAPMRGIPGYLADISSAAFSAMSYGAVSINKSAFFSPLVASQTACSTEPD